MSRRSIYRTPEYIKKRKKYIRKCDRKGITPIVPFIFSDTELKIIKGWDGDCKSTGIALGIDPKTVYKAVQIPQVIEKIKARDDARLILDEKIKLLKEQQEKLEKQAEELGKKIKLDSPSVMHNAIANRHKRQEFWTKIMDGEIGTQADGRPPHISDRIKASELLGKSEGDFIDRVENSGTNQSIIQVVPLGITPKGLLSAAPLQVSSSRSEYIKPSGDNPYGLDDKYLPDPDPEQGA